MRSPYGDSVSSVLEKTPCPTDPRGRARRVLSRLFRHPVRLLSGAVIACTLLGCGNTLYALRINNAAGRFEEARTMGAEEAAPYEYYSAEVRLQEARRQAARAEYGTAADLAHEAERYAAKAINKTRVVKAGGAP
jgi:hypothetical protein